METEEKSIYGLFLRVHSKPCRRQAYFGHINNFKPVLGEHYGRICLYRYQSLDVPDLILLHQNWASEAPLVSSEANLIEIAYG